MIIFLCLICFSIYEKMQGFIDESGLFILFIYLFLFYFFDFFFFFLSFTQKFKMAAKSGGKTIFEKSCK